MKNLTSKHWSYIFWAALAGSIIFLTIGISLKLRLLMIFSDAVLTGLVAGFIAVTAFSAIRAFFTKGQTPMDKKSE